MLRIRELDALRALAALAVLLFHLTYRYDPDHLSPVSVSWGHYGVELFFIISGFVILMTAERAASVGDFIASRVARLFPVYWPAVIITAAVAFATERHRPSVADIAANLSMLPLYLGFDFLDDSYWTLEIEIAFYVGVGILLITRQLPRIEWWCAAWLAIAAAVKLSDIRIDDPWQSATALYHGQFFIIGIALYRLRTGKMRPLTWVILAGSLGLSLLGSSRYAGSVPAEYFVVSLVAAVLCWAGVTHRLAFLLFPPLLWLGDISYPLYLIHQRLGASLIQATHHRGLPGWLCILGSIAAIVALASALHVLFEVPGRRILRKALTSRWLHPFASWATPTSEALAGENPAAATGAGLTASRKANPAPGTR